MLGDVCVLCVQLMQQNLPANIANTPLALPRTETAANAATTGQGWELFYLVYLTEAKLRRIEVILFIVDLLCMEILLLTKSVVEFLKCAP